MQIQDPASQRLTWYKPPLAVLVIKKVRDSTVLSPFIQLVEWLIEEKHMVVWVESAVQDDPLLMEDKKFLAVKDKLVTFKWVVSAERFQAISNVLYLPTETVETT